MLFETAGIQVNPLIPPLVAFVVSFFTSMGGVSGAFLLLPFQMTFLGYINPSVSATNQLFNVVAIPSGVYRYCSRSRFNRDNVLNLAKYDPARPFFFCRGEDPAWVTRFHQ